MKRTTAETRRAKIAAQLVNVLNSDLGKQALVIIRSLEDPYPRIDDPTLGSLVSMKGQLTLQERVGVAQYISAVEEHRREENDREDFIEKQIDMVTDLMRRF